MLPDSMNVGVIADNIRSILDKIKDISGHILPATTSATTGQILKLTGENKTPTWSDEYSYTPPAYSETEVNTGQKWIDGKDIYTKCINTSFPNSSGGKEVGAINCDTLIQAYVTLVSTAGTKVSIFGGGTITITNTGQGAIATSNTTYQGQNCICVFVYTHPNPEPETREDDPSKDVTNYDPEQEPETKTTRTKKSTK